jgi:hypothetical protein
MAMRRRMRADYTGWKGPGNYSDCTALFSPQFIAGLPRGRPAGRTIRASNTVVATLRRRKGNPMQSQRRPSALCARTVAVEMTNLMVYGLLVGAAVAVLMAVPVVLLAAA